LTKYLFEGIKYLDYKDQDWSIKRLFLRSLSIVTQEKRCPKWPKAVARKQKRLKKRRNNNNRLLTGYSHNQLR
jgi:hypothetical protein